MEPEETEILRTLLLGGAASEQACLTLVAAGLVTLGPSGPQLTANGKAAINTHDDAVRRFYNDWMLNRGVCVGTGED
jgi:hypothetical protein